MECDDVELGFLLAARASAHCAASVLVSIADLGVSVVAGVGCHFNGVDSAMPRPRGWVHCNQASCRTVLGMCHRQQYVCLITCEVTKWWVVNRSAMLICSMCLAVICQFSGGCRAVLRACRTSAVVATHCSARLQPPNLSRDPSQLYSAYSLSCCVVWCQSCGLRKSCLAHSPYPALRYTSESARCHLVHALAQVCRSEDGSRCFKIPGLCCGG